MATNALIEINLNDYEVRHDFERISPRTILLNARRLDNVPFILLAMEDITARTQAKTQRQQYQTQLEQQVHERTLAWLLHDRRHRRDDERLTVSSEALVPMSMIRLFVTR